MFAYNTIAFQSGNLRGGQLFQVSRSNVFAEVADTFFGEV